MAVLGHMKVWFPIYALIAATGSFFAAVGIGFGYSWIDTFSPIIGLSYWGSMTGAWVGSLASLFGIVGLFLKKGWAGRVMKIGILGFSLSMTASVVVVLWVCLGAPRSDLFVDLLVMSVSAATVIGSGMLTWRKIT